MKKFLPFSPQLEESSIVSVIAKEHYFTEILFFNPPQNFTCLAQVFSEKGLFGFGYGHKML